MKIVIVSYVPLRLYPPALSAVNNLAAIADKVTIITRNLTKFEWQYPDNVQEELIGEYMDVKQSEVQPLYWKVANFLKFVQSLKKLIQQEKPDVVLMYDALSAYCYYIHRRKYSRMNHLAWYHNHDVVENKGLRKYSIGWFAAKNEPNLFQWIQLFTLPAAERKKFFPLDTFKGKTLVIPNYPSQTIYPARTAPRQTDNVIRLVFAGSISEGHGLEEIINLLNEEIEGRKIELHLLGPVGTAYLQSLQAIAEKEEVTNRLFYHGWHDFKKIPQLLSEYHIGLAINKPVGVIYSTGGTASNKIYEYAAMGFPVMLFDNEHHRNYLQQYSWAFFTDCSKASLKEQIRQIIRNYETLSAEAYKDFTEKLNFETVFSGVKQILEQRKNHSPVKEAVM